MEEGAGGTAEAADEAEGPEGRSTDWMNTLVGEREEGGTHRGAWEEKEGEEEDI